MIFQSKNRLDELKKKLINEEERQKRLQNEISEAKETRQDTEERQKVLMELKEAKERNEVLEKELSKYKENDPVLHEKKGKYFSQLIPSFIFKQKKQQKQQKKQPIDGQRTFGKLNLIVLIITTWIVLYLNNLLIFQKIWMS